MKKLLLIAALVVSILTLAPAAFAQTSGLTTDTGNTSSALTPSSSNAPSALTPSAPNTTSAVTATPGATGALTTTPGNTSSALMPSSPNTTSALTTNTAATPGTAAASSTTAPASTGTGFQPLAPIPGLTQGATATQTGLAQFFNNLYKFLIGTAAVLAVIQIICGGIEYATVENVGKKGEGRKHIQQAILGLVIVLSPALVLGIINPSILNLSLALPALNLQAGNSVAPVAGGNGTVAPATTDTSTGCSVTGQKGFLQTATCPSMPAATQWASANCSGRTPSGDPTTLMKDSSGNATSVVTHCEYQASTIMFVNVGQSGLTSTFSFQPIGAQNASAFQTFQNGCASSGGQLCSLNPNGAGVQPVDCPKLTTQFSASQSGKCYYLQLSCFTQADADNANSFFTVNIFNGAAYNECTPDIQFVPDAIY